MSEENKEQDSSSNDENEYIEEDIGYDISISYDPKKMKK